MIPSPPPKLEDLRAGYQLNAGLGVATILPDIDFETYSPAGFEWDETERKFSSPRGASIKGLPVTGAARYTEHPDAEVLCLAYNLKDGSGAKLWVPGDDLPHDLLNHISSGNLIEAWNVAFEYWVWNNICVSKYNFPPLSPLQIRCAAAKSRAHALPGSLDPAGEVVDIKNKKDKDGKRLINKFSIPRNPTLKNKSLRTLPTDDPQDANNLYNYCLRDIEAESELSSKTPDLSEAELKFWQCDHAINVRGIQIDIPLINNCINILEQAYKKYDQELYRITNGQVKSASQLPSLKKWLISQGVPVEKLAAEDLSTLKKTVPLYRTEIHRVIDIREMTGSASVKKLYAMANQVTRDNRLHDLFIYHSARTGRAAGTGPQPQNLPNSGPNIKECVCGKSYRVEQSCPWCGMISEVLEENGYESSYKTSEWNTKAVEDAIEILNTGSLECVEYYFGDAVEIISSCLRGMFISAPGKDLICSDYSAIEAVVLAALAGEQWRLDVFNTHGKIYETSASKITGTSLEEYELYKASSGSHHPDRKLGKVAELACFTHDTQVLTNRGYIDIVDVTVSDKLWDGVEWITHEGVINKGKRGVITLDGVKMTPNHPISLGDSWKEAWQLDSNENILCQALGIGLVNLPILKKTKKGVKEEIDSRNVNVAAEIFQPRVIAICELENQLGVMFAQKKLQLQLQQNGLNSIGFTKILCQMLKIEGDSEEELVQLLGDAITLEIQRIKIMADEVLKYAKNGEKIEGNFLSTYHLLRDGITQCLKWIELIVTEITNLEISDLYLNQIINLIKEKLEILKKSLMNSENVYDIVNAGPRNRFTIKTNSGHLIVHNSGYQGAVGAWKAFGADEFFTDEVILEKVKAWRAASPNIVRLWYGLEGAAINAVSNPGEEFEYRGLKYICKQDVLYCKLLSGRLITYHKPILSPHEKFEGKLSLSFEGWNTNPKYGKTGWVRMNTYGGKLTENVVQATARDILANAVINLEESGYPVVLHVHDEIVVEMEEGKGTVEEVETIMSMMPGWAKGWPVKAKGGWRAKRYNK